MKLRGPDNVLVYYVTAVVSVLMILSYIAAGEVTPIVGFLVGGVLVFALYPNKTIALVVGILVSAVLRNPKREGFKEGEAKPDGEDAKKVLDSAKAALEKLTPKEGVVSGPSKATSESKPTAPAASATPATPVGNTEDKTKGEKPKDGFVGTRELSPSEYNTETTQGGASGPQDIEKLSLMIDKTMELLKMLPDGFLANASK